MAVRMEAATAQTTPTLNQCIDMIDIFILLSSQCIPVCISGRIPDFRHTTLG